MGRFGPALVAFCLLAASGGAKAAGAGSVFGARGLRMGYSSRLLLDVSLQDAQTAMALWTRELNRLAGLKTLPRTKIYEDLPSLVAALQNGEVDFVALNCVDYKKVSGSVPIEPALVGMKGGSPWQEMVLLVHRTGGVDRITRLRGKRMTLMSGGGEVASLWLDTVLGNHGMPTSRKTFASMTEVGKAQQAILPVFFRKADACVVTRSAFRTLTELNPQIGRDLEVLAVSPKLATGITCFRRDMSEAEKKEFLRLTFKLIETPAGRQIMTLFKTDGIARVPAGYMDSLEALVRDAERVRFPEGARR